MFISTEQIINDFKEKCNYICDYSTATSVLLAAELGKPLLVEGEAGVGKTELAKVIAKVTNRKLIRLQCYEGIDETSILYEWAYAKQLLYAEILRSKINSFLSGTKSLKEAVEKVQLEANVFFDFNFLHTRPLLKALTSEEPVILLIDEIDRSDRETEAFLLEALSDFQVSIPEIGTIIAKTKPYVVLTSNNTRELSDALKRRCIYLYIDLPTFDQELQILRLKVPGLNENLANQIMDFLHKLRRREWKKIPSISESIDWAMALVSLNIDKLDLNVVSDTINLLLKHKTDILKSQAVLSKIIGT
ncbi:MAG: AAA family ATPase [Candidatus Helarchaeota archaeon]